MFRTYTLITNSSQLEIEGQAEADEIYQFIAEDLKYAISNLPPIQFSAMASDENGRVTKWFAEGFAARVFLFYTGYYGKSEMPGMSKTEVIDYLDDVIRNSGHALLANFSSLWPWSIRKDYWEKQPLYIGTKDLTYAGEVMRKLSSPSRTGSRGRTLSALCIWACVRNLQQAHMILSLTDGEWPRLLKSV